MSLMQLLSVGQSLKKHSTAPSPYKVKAGTQLPKFAVMPRPISLAPPEKPASVPPDLFSSARAQAVLDAAAPEAPAAAVAEPPEPLPAVAAEPAPRPVRKPRKGFLFFRPVAEVEQRLVQSELALQSVKVVRNDLNETDFEIVAPRPAPPVAAAAPLPPPAEVRTKSKPLWQRITDRAVGFMRTLL